MDIREVLHDQIIEEYNQGDTTVLFELLGLLTDDQIHNALSDINQDKTKVYYDVHINQGKNGYSIAVVCPYEMEHQRVIDKAVEEDLFRDEHDYLYVDSITEISFKVWDEHFNLD